MTCKVDPISDRLRVTTQIEVAQQCASEHVVIEAGDPRIWVSQADTAGTRGTLNVTVEMMHPSGTLFALERGAVRISVLGGERLIDIQGCTAD